MQRGEGKVLEGNRNWVCSPIYISRVGAEHFGVVFFHKLWGNPW